MTDPSDPSVAPATAAPATASTPSAPRLPERTAERTPDRTADRTAEQTADREQVSVRRAPRISAFLVVGGFLGFIGTLIATSLYPADPTLGFTTLLAYFSLYGISIGVLIGAVVAIIVDRRSRRRARTVDAAREQVDPAPLEGEVED